MLLTNLNPKQYKRFFAFGCSFTNYCWPTWADIIAQDIPFYENWGKRGGGNHFIFNSVIEANKRHKFNQDDLVMIMWSSTSREDRYSNGAWLHAVIEHQEEVYGTEWLRKFGIDKRAHLVHSFTYIEAVQQILTASGCAWVNFVMHPIVKIADYEQLFKKLKITDEYHQREYWYNAWNKLCAGDRSVIPLFEEPDVIECYKDIFTNITASYEDLHTYSRRNYENTPRVDSRINPHPTPLQALEFLDRTWPDNALSKSARKYASYWNDQIYINTDWSKPIHKDPTINRL